MPVPEELEEDEEEETAPVPVPEEEEETDAALAPPVDPPAPAVLKLLPPYADARWRQARRVRQRQQLLKISRRQRQLSGPHCGRLRR